MAGDETKRVLPAGTLTGPGNSTETQDQEYLNSVVLELKRREQRLAKIDEEIQKLEFELRELSADRIAKRGDALRLGSLEAYKKGVRGKLGKAKSSRVEAAQDVERARERKRSLEQEG